MAPINESNPPENRDTAVMSSKHLLCSYLMDGIDTDKTKVAIIGEIWKSRAKLLRNRLFKKIASATE